MSERADRIVFADSSRELSGAQVGQRVSWAAGGLVAAGIRHGHELVLAGRDRTVDQAVLQLAALRVGAVLTMRAAWPVGPASDSDSVRRHVAVLDADGERTCPSDDRGGISAAKVLGATKPWNGASPGPADSAIVLETTGTTGRPRRVLLSHAALRTRITSLTGLLVPDHERVFAARMPANSVDAFREVIGSVLTGATLRFPPRSNADAQDEVSWLHDSGITALIIVPSVVQSLRSDERWRMRDVRDWILTGEAAPTSLVRGLLADRPGRRVYDVYGCTEAPGCGNVFTDAAALSPSAPPLVPVGPPLGGVTVSIVDWWGRPVGAGTVGEVYLGGAGVAVEYKDDPRSTAAAFLPDPAVCGGRRFATGDLAMSSAGAVHLVGRRDRRVKLHANSVDLDEVEAALVALPGITGAAAALPSGPVPGSIEVWVAADRLALDPAAIVRSLQEKFGSHLVAHPLHILDRLPRLPLGKIDRRALRSAATAAEPTGKATFAAPRTETERIIARVCQEELGRTEIGIDDDFFALGGDSLAAARVVGRLRREAGLDLERSTVLTARTVREVAAVAVSRGTATRVETRTLVQWDGELNRDQQGMWLVDTLNASSTAYTLSAAALLSTDVPPDDIDWGWAIVCERHPILSSRWCGGQGRPSIVSSRHIPALRRTAVADARALSARQTQFAREPLPLTDGAALVRAEIVQDGVSSRLLLAMHHLIADAESFRIIRRDLRRALSPQFPADPRVYRAPIPVDADPSDDRIEEFRRAVPRIALSARADRGDRSSLATRRTVIPVDAKADVLARAAAAHSTTAYTILLAAVTIVVARHADVTTFAVATPVTARDDPNLLNEVGYFATTAAVLCDVQEDDTVCGLVRRLQRSVARALDSRDVPFDRLVDRAGAARTRGVIPLTQIMVTVDAPLTESPEPSVIAPFESLDRGMGPFDLAVEYQPEQRRVIIDTRTVAIPPEEAAVLTEHIANVLAILAKAEAGTRASDIELTSAAERAQLTAWTAGEPADSPAPLVGRIATTFAKHADRPAILWDRRSLTYAELGSIVQSVRDRFARSGLSPGSRIAIVDNHPVLTVAAVVACLFDGHPFVPVDPQAPAARVQRIREVVDATLVVDASEPPSPALARLGPSAPVPRSRAAYVAFSSGSTDVPKGVELPRSGLDELGSWVAEGFGVTRDSVVFQPASFGFDIWLLNTIMSLTTGAALHVRPPSRMGFGIDLAEDLRDARATHVTVSTAAWETVRPEWVEAQALTVVIAGSRCTEDLARRWSGHVRLFNGYGPCETTVISSLKLCPPATIGHACPGESIQVLDSHGRPCPIGVPGWLHIGGSGVGIGYIEAPRRTALAFRPDPFAARPGGRRYATGDRGYRLPNGEVEYIGRRDRQVKLRGYRIELDELEGYISTLADVRTVAVEIRKPEVLTCCVVTTDAATTADSVRATLQDHLPAYSVPNRILVVGQIPLTVNGKPDWPAIDDLARKRVGAPEGLLGPAADAVADAWRTVLGHDRFMPTDNFFDVGGHSLLMPALQASLSQKGLDVDLVTLFRYASVTGLTNYLGRTSPAPGPIPLRRARRPGADRRRARRGEQHE
nr:AMP-binding protein [Streptomyces sp. SID13588]